MKSVCLNVIFCLLVFVFSGCTTGNDSLSAQDFTKNDQKESQGGSKLKEGDSIEISVEVDGNMEVSLHRAKLNYYGVATLPLIGDVAVVGLQLGQARQKIAKQYGEFYVTQPVIMISVVDDETANSRGYVTVLGRVTKPGRVPLASQDGMTLSEAIQLAGGFSSSAKKTEIRVSRVNSSGKKIQVSIDFLKIGKQGDVDADIALVDGDIIYVPERMF